MAGMIVWLSKCTWVHFICLEFVRVGEGGECMRVCACKHACEFACMRASVRWSSCLRKGWGV